MDKKGPIELYKDRLQAIDRRRLLRPLQTAEVIDIATRLYQSRARLLLARTAVPVLFCYLAAVFFQTFVLPDLFATAAGESFRQDLARLALAVVVTVFVAVPLFVYGLGQSQILSTRLASPYILGEPPPEEEPPLTLRDSLRMTLLLGIAFFVSLAPLWTAAILFVFGGIIQASAPRNIAAGVLATFAILILVCGIFLVPALLYRYTLAPVVLVVEGLPVRKSIQRGFELLKGQVYGGGPGGAVLTAWILLLVVFLLTFSGFQLVFSLLTSTGALAAFVSESRVANLASAALAMVPGYLSVWILVPFWSSFATVLYYDRRVRLEALDIRILANDVLDANRPTAR